MRWLLLLLSLPCWGAVAFNNTNTMTNTLSNTASGAFSVTAGGSNLAAFAVIGFDHTAGASISSVTYAGASMTAVASAACNATSNACTQIWYKLNPATGSNTLAVTGNANVNEIYMNLVSFTGVDQTNPVRGTPGSATGNGTAPALTVTSNANDLTLTVVDSGGPTVSSTNQTSDGLNNGGAFGAGSDHATTAGASITHTWTLGASGNWVISGFSICNSGDCGGGGGGTPLFQQSGLNGITTGGPFFANPITFGDLVIPALAWIWRIRFATARKAFYARLGLVAEPVLLRSCLAGPVDTRFGIAANRAAEARQLASAA